MSPGEVARLLENVYDPELGIDIVSLGLLYGISVRDGVIEVMLTTTSADCPLGSVILEAAEQFLSLRTTGYEVRVNPTFEPPWDVEMVDDRARVSLGIPPRVRASA